MTHNWIRITLYGCFVLLLASCSAIGAPTLPEEGAAVPASPPTAANTQTEAEMTQPTPSSGMQALIEKARQDLAQRLSVELTQISLVEAREVVWPDSSLGCPQPGMAYKQIPYDGALIVLQAQGTTYEYHNGGSRGLFLCEKGISNPEKPPKIDLTDLTPRLQEDKNPPPPTPDQGIPPGEDQ